MGGTLEPTNTKRERSIPFAAILGALLVGAVVGGATYFSGRISQLGAAVVAGSVAALTGALTEALTKPTSRPASWWIAGAGAIATAGVMWATWTGAPSGYATLVGGCKNEPFTVFSQNRWAPLGAAIRATPLVESEQVGSAAPNKVLLMDGWVRSRTAHPENAAPWNSDVWFHLADNKGWVSFAGVRADPTSPDPQDGYGDGGRPAATDAACSGSIRWPSGRV